MYNIKLKEILNTKEKIEEKKLKLKTKKNNILM